MLATKSNDVTVHLPKLFAVQQEIRRHPAKRKVINAGRRGGKTTLVSYVAVVDYFLAGKKVAYIAPVNKQTKSFWLKCKRYVRDLIAKGLIHKNETERTLTLPGGGEISCQTGHDADTIRSGDADLLIFDENAFMDPKAWDTVGAPMLLDRDGDAWFISTPNRRNHHFAQFQQGVSDGEYWHSWKYTSFDNPHLSKTALDKLAENMTEQAIRQEIYAEFLENEGAVFRNIPACIHADQNASPDQHAGHKIVAGVDWGKHNDFTAISIGCEDCCVELALDRFNQIDYSVQRGRLGVLVDKWKPRIIFAESNAMGEPIIEQLRIDGLPVVGFQTTAQSKPPLIENMALAFERAEWQFLDYPVATGELEAYERKVSAVTGRSAYSAPEGMHDDTVMARALMIWARTQYHAIEVRENPFYG